MCHAYLNIRQILGKSQVNLGQISGKSQAYPFYIILIRLEIASLRVAAASGS